MAEADKYGLIRTYGLFWEREKVVWGYEKPGQPVGEGNESTNPVQSPGLWGKLTKQDAKAVNFNEQRGIYALYSNYEVVYVGQAGRVSSGSARLFKRLQHHQKDDLADRWDRFSWFGIKYVKKNDGKLSQDTDNYQGKMEHALDILEAISIAIADPRLNRQRGRWKTTKTERYFQCLPPDTAQSTANGEK